MHPYTEVEQPRVTAPAFEECPAVRDTDALGVPGATLVPDFVTREEAEELLDGIASDPRWERLAKR